MCFVPKWKKEWRQCTALCFAGILFTAGFFGLSSAFYYFASLYCIILHCIILSRARWPAWQNGKGRSWWLIGGGREGGQRRQRSLMLKWEILGLGFEESRKIRGGGSLVLKGRVSQRQDIGDDVGENKMMLNFTSWRENWVKWFQNSKTCNTTSSLLRKFHCHHIMFVILI